MNSFFAKIAAEHTRAVEGFFAAEGDALAELASRCAAALRGGKKLLLCGNGGSACDAMHIAGEFVGRFVDDRPALAAIALSADTGILTAVANDYAYDYVFARQVEALGQPGDVLICLSTSGRSPNVVRALAAAQARQIVSVLFAGEKLRDVAPVPADMTLVVPSRVTAHVQEAHMVALHALVGMIEMKISTSS